MTTAVRRVAEANDGRSSGTAAFEATFHAEGRLPRLVVIPCLSGMRIPVSDRRRLERRKTNEPGIGIAQTEACRPRQRNGRRPRAGRALRARAGSLRRDRSSAPSRASTTTASCCRRCSRATRQFDDIIVHDDAWYAQHNVDLRKGETVVAIDRATRKRAHAVRRRRALRHADHRDRLAADPDSRFRRRACPASSRSATSTTSTRCSPPPSRAATRW